MIHEAYGWLAPRYRYLQGVDHEICPLIREQRPSDDLASMSVEDESQVEKPTRVDM